MKLFKQLLLITLLVPFLMLGGIGAIIGFIASIPCFFARIAWRWNMDSMLIATNKSLEKFKSKIDP